MSNCNVIALTNQKGGVFPDKLPPHVLRIQLLQKLPLLRLIHTTDAAHHNQKFVSAYSDRHTVVQFKQINSGGRLNPSLYSCIYIISIANDICLSFEMTNNELKHS